MSKLSDPEYRISQYTSDAVFANTARIINNNCYAIYSGDVFELSDLGIVGYILSNTDNILSVIQKYSFYQKFFGIAVELSFEEYTDAVHVFFTDSLKKYNLPGSRYRIECVISCLLKLCSLLTGRSMEITEIHLSHILEKHKKQYSDYLQSPIKTGRKQNVIIFSRKYLESQKVLNKSSLGYLENYIKKRMKSTESQLSFTDMIIEYLLNKNSFNERIEDVASNFFINKRTLQKRLKKTGTTFREILANIKKEKAIQLLNDRQLNINQISDVLGFEETVSFIRAFQKWTGQTPGRYRTGL